MSSVKEILLTLPRALGLLSRNCGCCTFLLFKGKLIFRYLCTSSVMIDHGGENRFELPLHFWQIAIHLLIDHCTFFLKLLKKQSSLPSFANSFMLTFFLNLLSWVILILDVLIRLQTQSVSFSDGSFFDIFDSTVILGNFADDLYFHILNSS